MRIDLVDDRQEIVGPQAVAPVNLVDANGLDLPQFAVGQAPLHKPFDRAIHRFPTGLKYQRCLSPAQPAAPPGQESHHGASHRALAVTPGDMLDYGPVLPALDSPWCVEEIGGDSPQGHKQPAPPGQLFSSRLRPS
jgi:hypothetical protein